VDRYEEIRRAFSDRRQGVMMWGLVVLKTKGMAVWTRSWREHSGGSAMHMPSVTSVPAASSRLSPNNEAVVRVLAAMVWAVQEEATS